MALVTISGASDDVIDISGDVEDEGEFYHDDGEQGRLSFSDGTTLQIIFTREGVWRIAEGATGTATLRVIRAAAGNPDGDGPARTDVAHLNGDIDWIEVASDGGRSRRRVAVGARS